MGLREKEEEEEEGRREEEEEGKREEEEEGEREEEEEEEDKRERARTCRRGRSSENSDRLAFLRVRDLGRLPKQERGRERGRRKEGGRFDYFC